MFKADLDLIIEVAVELKIAKLKSEDKGIYSYRSYGNYFQISNNLFQRLFNDKPYKTESFDNDFQFQYKGTIEGISFITITNELLFEGDEDVEIKKTEEYRCLED